VSSRIREILLRLLRAIRPLIERFISVGFVQSGVVLAAQAFMALFPLLIGIVALAPPRVGDAMADYMRDRMGMAGDPSEDVQHLVASRDDLRGGITVFGLIVVLASATSFTRALQRAYEHSWQLPKGGVRGSIRGLFWLLGLTIYLVMLAIVLQLTKSQDLGIVILHDGVVIASALGLWWMTPFLLLCGRVQLRALAFTAILTALVVVIAGLVSTVVMPRIVSSNEKQFGTIGVVFAAQSWLVVMGGIIVGAAIVGAVATQSEGWLGTLARGSPEPESWRRVPAGRFSRREGKTSPLAAIFAAAGVKTSAGVTTSAGVKTSAGAEAAGSTPASADGVAPPAVPSPKPSSRSSSDPE
jgi:membrane protein